MLAELMSTKEVGDIKAGTTGSPGVFMGDGLLPVPAKIVDRIGKGEFIEMYELLPELWSSQSSDTDSSKQAKRAKGKKRVQYINVWLQCYALYVGLKAQTNPKLIPELMAYQISILQASQEYEGAA